MDFAFRINPRDRDGSRGCAGECPPPMQALDTQQLAGPWGFAGVAWISF